MVINYFGDGCFRLQSGDISLLVDPNNNRLKADIVLKTIMAPNAEMAETNEISFPGEYEFKDIHIQGWPVDKESTEKFLKTVYLVKWENLGFVFLGHLSNGLEPEIAEEFSEQDVIFVPVGDHFLSEENAAKLAKKLEPAVIIPGFLKKHDSFAKALGQKPEIQEKFVFKKKDLENLKNKPIILKSA
ncbi:MAG: MBL fold metallo-hydrolase [Candidatus Liptonbacteria bacterium]|nr:MBL fold metallo-hydrolase [Candidatus Liptonbacteria bacterium]